MAEAASSVVVAIPVYKPELALEEAFAVEHSLSRLNARACTFVAPAGLDLGYYRERWPRIAYVTFPAEHFVSVASYSRLLLDDGFYARFAEHEYLLVLQPDAILFRDELDGWIATGVDYVGAPWPDGIEFTLWRDNFQGERRQRVRTHVGNGGLSLRRIARCRALLAEFPETLEAFRQAGTNEDAYFSLLGPQSAGFRIPDELTASRFSMELQPRDYLVRNGGYCPMGAHGWTVHARSLWAGLPGGLGPMASECSI
jgi:hypothetical protein